MTIQKSNQIYFKISHMVQFTAKRGLSYIANYMAKGAIFQYYR